MSTQSVSQYCIAFRIVLYESKKNDLFFGCFLLNNVLKGAANLIITVFYMKDLNKP